MNWKMFVDENGDVHTEDWGDWSVYDFPRVSLLRIWSQAKESNLEEYSPGRYIEYQPEHRNTGP